MKSQDIGLLLKLICLRNREAHDAGDDAGKEAKGLTFDWRGWSSDEPSRDWIQESSLRLGKDSLSARYINSDWTQESLPRLDKHLLSARYSVRALAEATGISKSQISLSLQRCQEVGLTRKDRRSGVPRVNNRALLDFIVHGVRYVFPAKPGEITRGIATTFAAPVLEGRLYSAGELPMVWSDARGNSKGQSIEPLFKSVPYAVRRDPELYSMLALVDAIRLGHPRENRLATHQLAVHMGCE